MEATFVDRFATPSQVEKYAKRFRKRRHVRMERCEVAALRTCLATTGRVPVAVDVACGTGRLSTVLGEFADRLILLDASFAMLAAARNQARLGGAHFVAGMAQALPLQTDQVDLVFCNRMFNHINESSARATVLADFRRASRRWVLIPFYARSIRTRTRWSLRRLWNRDPSVGPLLRFSEFLGETDRTGLALRQVVIVRRFPWTARFCLFEVSPGS